MQQLAYFCSEPNTSYPYGGVNYSTLDLAFTCLVLAPRHAQAADDVQEIRFLPTAKVRPQEFAFSSTRRIVQRFLSARGAGL